MAGILLIFLYNLDNIKFQQFQEWTNEFLGFQVEKDGIGYDGINKGYVSIYIRKMEIRIDITYLILDSVIAKSFLL